MACGIPAPAATDSGRSRGPSSSTSLYIETITDVVVAVVAALDLDDEVAPGDGPHQVDGVHRGLGARVAEAPQGQPEAPAELLGHDDGVLGRLGEVGAERHPALHRLDDRRVGVTDEHHAVAGVQVDVLGPVDVVAPSTLPVADPDRARAGDHPAGRGPAGERRRRPAPPSPPSVAGGPGTRPPPGRSGR